MCLTAPETFGRTGPDFGRSNGYWALKEEDNLVDIRVRLLTPAGMAAFIRSYKILRFGLFFNS